MPVPVETKKLSRLLMRREVYSTLREWIIGGTLEPGEKLKDAELARALGVSRMPVREAFLRLEDEGLIETAANRWTRVSFVDAEQAKRIYPILCSLESLAVSLAVPRLREADLRSMSEANERLTRALEADQPILASEADRQFHEVFVNKADNQDLSRMIEELRSKLRRLEVSYFGGSMIATQSTLEHEDIIEALTSGDAERVRRTVEANWRKSLQRILDRFDASSTQNDA